MHTLRSRVVVRRDFERESIQVAQMECFRDLLFVGSALIAPAHDCDYLSGSDAKNEGEQALETEVSRIRRVISGLFG